MNIIVEINNLVTHVLFGENSISLIFISIIAGIFGFIIAAIPLTIQLLEIKDDKVIDKINENQYMKEKIFNSYIDTLKTSFYLIVLIILIEIFEKYIRINSFIEFIVFFLFIYCVFRFLKNLYNLIGVLTALIRVYLQIKK